MLISTLLVLTAQAMPAAATTRAVDIAEPNPREMSRAEITKFNAQLDRTHPYYIRCVRTLETGSLVKKSYSCRTNEKWEIAERTGSQNARETVEAMQKSSTNGN